MRPWMIIGDFNHVLNPSEKISKNPTTLGATQFQETMFKSQNYFDGPQTRRSLAQSEK